MGGCGSVGGWVTGKAHTCLDAFRAAPATVLRWRKLWHALPKADRHHRLVHMFRAHFDHCASLRTVEDTSFSMRFHVLGVVVCRAAFIAVTGICAETLQHARHVSLGGAIRDPRMHGLWVARRPLAYMDARAWLLEYARTHGGTSPLQTQIFLPVGRKQFYYACYFRDRVERGVAAEGVASLPRFLAAWRQELPWVAIRSTCSPFTHCGLCDYFKMLIGGTRDLHVRQMLLMRPGEHYGFQGAQRIAMSNVFRESERDPAELCAVAWDKMDQAKTIIPRIKQLASTHFVKGGAAWLSH